MQPMWARIAQSVLQLATGWVVRESNPGRFRWPCGLKRDPATARLLGLRVRIPPMAWTFVLCVLYSKDKRAKPRQSGQRSTDKILRIRKAPVVATFSAPVLTGPVSDTASSSMGKVSLLYRVCQPPLQVRSAATTLALDSLIV